GAAAVLVIGRPLRRVAAALDAAVRGHRDDRPRQDGFLAGLSAGLQVHIAPVPTVGAAAVLMLHVAQTLERDHLTAPVASTERERRALGVFMHDDDDVLLRDLLVAESVAVMLASLLGVRPDVPAHFRYRVARLRPAGDASELGTRVEQLSDPRAIFQN